MAARLAGKTALVTGASAGIGRAVAERFAAEGARVILVARDRAAVLAAAAACGDDAIGIAADMAREDGIAQLFAVLAERDIQLDIVVANAGSGRFAPLGAIDAAHFDDTFDLNVRGTTFLVQGALPFLNDSGAIVLMSSVTAISGTPAFSIYSASKAAVRALARTWILDLKPRGIRVNVVSPGPTATPGLAAIAPPGVDPAVLQAHLAETIPVGRLGRPDEVAAAVLFLASDEASFVNGVDLAVDGGVAQI